MTKKIVVVLLSVFMLAVPGIAAAHNGVDHGSEHEAQQHEQSSTLDDAKKKLCENRALNIQAIMTRSVTRAENYGTLLATISDRLQAFSDNLGERSSQYNYAAVNSAQVAFQSSLTTLKSKATFSCETDAKAHITAFQEANKTVMQNLADWRASLLTIVSQLRTNEEAR